MKRKSLLTALLIAVFCSGGLQQFQCLGAEKKADGAVVRVSRMYNPWKELYEVPCGVILIHTALLSHLLTAVTFDLYPFDLSKKISDTAFTGLNPSVNWGTENPVVQPPEKKTPKTGNSGKDSVQRPAKFSSVSAVGKTPQKEMRGSIGKAVAVLPPSPVLHTVFVDVSLDPKEIGDTVEAKNALLESGKFQVSVDGQSAVIQKTLPFVLSLSEGKHRIRTAAGECLSPAEKEIMVKPGRSYVVLPLVFPHSTIRFENRTEEKSLEFFINGKRYFDGDRVPVPAFKRIDVEICHHNPLTRHGIPQRQFKVLYSSVPGETLPCTVSMEKEKMPMDDLFRKAMIRLDAARIDSEFNSAVRMLQLCADAGHPEAAYQVAVFHTSGRGCEGRFGAQDTTESCKFFLKAADLGHAESMEYIIRAVYQEKIPVSPKKFNRYLQELFDKTEKTETLLMLGQICKNGSRCSSRNLSLSMQCLKKAAALGNADAMYELSRLYEKDLGQSERAKFFLKKAAAAGSQQAKKKLQSMNQK